MINWTSQNILKINNDIDCFETDTVDEFKIDSLRKQIEPWLTRFADLLLYIEIIDHRDQKYIRKERCRLLRVEVKSHIEERLKNFMRDLDISPVFIRGLLRDFEVTPTKCKAWDEFEFDRY
ncbi:hypothetical protein [Zunongwangia sp.]|uniref:hypothetical protein n=1 Tax=Zunongwangia sp. TaxID=1965325 RepID=UPI003AA82F4D